MRSTRDTDTAIVGGLNAARGSMPESPRAFQVRISRLLGRHFSRDTIVPEWSSFRRGEESYAPRLDIAVGPFAMGQLLLGDEYDRLFRRNKHLCARLVAAHRENAGGGEHTDAVNVRSGNRNARCFLAIEVENQVSRKHLLGGAVNAAALGRIGVVVGWTPDKLNALLKLRSYFAFLSAVGKPSFSASNLLILAPEQLESALLGRVTA